MMQYLPLHFEPRLVDVHVDRKTIDLAFKIWRRIGFYPMKSDAE
jgi:macrodomain Ter protein organizer (MatP/YcbG family)